MLCIFIHINACSSVRDFTIWSITFYHFTRNTRTKQFGCPYIIESLRVTPSIMTIEYMDGAHDAIQEEEKRTKIEFYTIECAHKIPLLTLLLCTHTQHKYVREGFYHITYSMSNEESNFPLSCPLFTFLTFVMFMHL